METLLCVKNLKKSFGSKTILSDLSFSIEKGKILGLIGPNGAGKTTAFYLTMGLLKTDAGEVFFKGKNITNLPIHKRAKLGIGYLAQEPSVFQSLTVQQNLSCILETLPISKKEQDKRLEELLDELSLKRLRKEKARTLSGGERRRLEITRALITKPSLLLLDEPFANIDPIAIEDLKNLIRHLKEKGISVLITDHNVREIFSIVDDICLLLDKTIAFSGSKEKLLENEKARVQYLGKSFAL